MTFGLIIRFQAFQSIVNKVVKIRLCIHPEGFKPTIKLRQSDKNLPLQLEMWQATRPEIIPQGWDPQT